MFTRSSLRPALVVGVVVAATAWFATRAGDLNPPPGPVQPSMISLADIYNRMSTQENCPSCVWNYKFVSGEIFPEHFGQVATGSGVLHAIILSNNNTMGTPRIFDWVRPDGAVIFPPERTIAYLASNNTSTATTIVLDVRFAEGLFVAGVWDSGAPGYTLVYRLDP